MKSLRKWFTTVALGLILGVTTALNLYAQPPRAFTYQGFLAENGNPVPDGTYSFSITLTDPTGVTFVENLAAITVHDGIFDIVIGTPLIPSAFSFNGQITMTVVVNGTITLGPIPIWSAPYAINSEMVGGISASPVPVAGDLFPIPVGTGYTGTVKLDPGFLPNNIPNSLLQSVGITSINSINPDASGHFSLLAGSGITITPGTNTITISAPNAAPITSITAGPGIAVSGTGNVQVSVPQNGITSNLLAPNLIIQSTLKGVPAITVSDSEANGNAALMIKGGLAANNPTNLVDGSGLNSGSPETYWADEVSVPTTTTTSLQIYNSLISSMSTIVIMPFALNTSVGQLAITAQGSGTFTLSSSVNMGTGEGGSITGINYMVVNH
ncbi:MAG TPA: hypothetical protein VGM92_03385 [Candidatus Kapabacteria bacterium]